jgi:choline transport protein
MAEEVSHASTNVPRAMVASILLNGVMGLGMVLSWLYSMGNLVDALEDRSGYPFIYSFLFGTGTAGMTKGMTAIILVLISFAILSSIAAASRQTFTLARDHMIPASASLKKVRRSIFP